MSAVEIDNKPVYRYVWKNLDKEPCQHRMRLNNRPCVILAHGKNEFS